MRMLFLLKLLCPQILYSTGNPLAAAAARLVYDDRLIGSNCRPRDSNISRSYPDESMTAPPAFGCCHVGQFKISLISKSSRSILLCGAIARGREDSVISHKILSTNGRPVDGMVRRKNLKTFSFAQT
ncbi:NAD(P)-binding domain-containing protein [Cynara cardunculus var. scolymus]|uniref:NAD(P)-binding domain-containing protein n=1 Tax=Cynara cardunculus var. scolymus TaxID=59895 RepID=A0A103T467_CYNCS|nr:NAD(P)-binding domain-containing protein [Cynara cardunculus var. scolymus]